MLGRGGGSIIYVMTMVKTYLNYVVPNENMNEKIIGVACSNRGGILFSGRQVSLVCQRKLFSTNAPAKDSTANSMALSSVPEELITESFLTMFCERKFIEMCKTRLVRTTDIANSRI